MRILYITSELPYPLSSGYFRHYHFIRALGQRHVVTHLSLTSRPAQVAEAVEALSPHVERSLVFGASASGRGSLVARARGTVRLARALRTHGAVAEMKRAATALVDAGSVDVVLLSGKATVPVVRALAAPLVVDACDATSLRIEGELPLAGPRRRAWLRVQLARARRIERESVALTPYLAFASARDRAAMTGVPGRGEIVPQGVDVAYWRPGETRRRPRLLLHGVMSYRPNEDAALFLVEEVAPRVRERMPGVDVMIVGRDPSPRLLALPAQYPWVTVTGQVDDARPFFDEASVYCATLRFASGIQNKVLEALAMELPVVTTPPAAAGLALDGVQAPLVVGRSAEELAQATVALLEDEQERSRLAAAGRQFVAEHFTWERSIATLEALCRRASAPEEPAQQG